MNKNTKEEKSQEEKEIGIMVRVIMCVQEGSQEEARLLGKINQLFSKKINLN